MTEPEATPRKRTDLVEYELTLLGRYVHMGSRGKRTGALLERSAYILLSRLLIEGPMSIGELGEAFGLDASTVNRQTAALLRAGLAERIPDPDGGIARKFRITGNGERTLNAERAALVRSFDEVMAGWPAADVAAFAGYLRRYNTDIERLNGRPWPRPGREPNEGGPACSP